MFDKRVLEIRDDENKICQKKLRIMKYLPN